MNVLLDASPSRSRGAAALLAATLLFHGCGGAAPGFAPPDPGHIDDADVERIVTVLAADDMEGRAAFSPAAERAAAFIAEEFGAAGLRPLEGSEGFVQRFPVYRVRAEDVRVALNGVTLPDGDVHARISSAELTWTTGDVEVVVVGADDDLQEVVFGLFRNAADALVLVHPSHRASVSERMMWIFSEPTMTLQPGGETDVVLAVAEAEGDVEYDVSATAHIEEAPLMNVAGMVPGARPDEMVLFSAHYDHVGIRRPVDGDSIYNGANDDASGTAAVVSLAKYFAARGTPERTLLFVAFAAEEMGGYGSERFAKDVPPEHIVAMFNIEMIGKPAMEGPNSAWITGFERSSLGAILQEAVEGTGFTFHPDPYPDQNLFYRSDNATLARLGVPAHSISTTPIDVDPDYHRPSDEVGTLDLEHMSSTIRAIALGAESIVTGEATPTRVDPATVN